MRIKIASDLHYETNFDTEGQTSLLAQGDYDHLVIAGDLATSSFVGETLRQILDAISPRGLLYVPGNHEYWHTSFDQLWRRLDEVSDEYPTFAWLNPLDGAAKIDGQRFIGDTLWFPKSEKAEGLRPWWPDFRFISDPDWIYFNSDSAKEFFNTNLREGDILVTHHLPSPKSINPDFANEETNCYFVNDIEALILERTPKLVVHGHTHRSCDYHLANGTRVVCSPVGYPNERGCGPRAGLIVEV